MKKGFLLKSFIYVLCVSFLGMMNGMPRWVAEAKERNLPIGEMISKGEVMFEVRANIWKKVESSHFPIFQGTKMKTDQGMGTITLSNNSQIKVNPNSLFSFDPYDRLILSKGSIVFYIPSASEINFKVGNLSIVKSRTLQAAKGSSVAFPKDEETIGAITIHSNGSATVKSIQGKLSILNQDHTVLASVSSGETITIPSITTSGKERVKVAQAPPAAAAGAVMDEMAAAGAATTDLLVPWWLVAGTLVLIVPIGTLALVETIYKGCP